MRNCRSAAGSLVAVLVMGCTAPPTSSTEVLGPNYRVKGGGSGEYQLSLAPLPEGFQAFIPRAVSGAHLVIGSLVPSAASPSGEQVPAIWEPAGNGAVEPLGVPAGLTLVRLTALTTDGRIIGNARTAAGARVVVRWDRTGNSWGTGVVRQDAEAHGMRDDGVVVGAVFRDPNYPNEHPTPVFWDASGAETSLPLPAGWNAGVARAINAAGDIAGEVQVWSLGMATISGAVWIREADGYSGPIVLQVGPSAGLSDRDGAGELRAIASSLREAWWYRLAPAGGEAWSKTDSVRIGGTAVGMNAAGAYVGTLLKGGYSQGGAPYLADVAGAVTRLPLPRGKVGTGVGVSGDAWVVGTVEGAGAMWRP